MSVNPLGAVTPLTVAEAIPSVAISRSPAVGVNADEAIEVSPVPAAPVASMSNWLEVASPENAPILNEEKDAEKFVVNGCDASTVGGAEEYHNLCAKLPPPLV